MINTTQSLILIAVMSGVTILIRCLPFICFSKGTPKAVIYLGNVLPGAIIAMLVVYCLKDISFISKPYGLPQIISVLFVVLLHKWKHNTLLSIFAGTVCYMLLIQFVMKI